MSCPYSSLRHAGGVLALAAVLLATFPIASVAQTTTPVVTRTIAIENANVVSAPGQPIQRATVLIRDGIIEAVGRDVRIPFDAQRIAGDSLFVYAGFIDGLSHVGIEQPAAAANQERVERPGSPPPDRAGIQPQRRAADMAGTDAASITRLREIGFTAAHVVPHGHLLPGTGTVIALADRPREDLVIVPDASLFAQFQQVRGVYPSTDMASLAVLRQLYREAERRQGVEARYAEDPRGLARPSQDAVHQAFYPVIRGERPLFFFTEGAADALQVHRVLDLQRNLGFPLVLAGLSQGFEVAERVREAGHSVLLTLGLPDQRDEARAEEVEDTTRAITPEPPSTHFISDHRTFTYADVDAERENLLARQAAQRERYYANAAELHNAGVAFGFTTKGVEVSDIHGNLRRMIEHGLPEDAALAALTTNPARILGLSDRLGTVETGKIANLVVANGPLFAEDTRIRYVFVDGERHRVSRDDHRTDDGDNNGEADPVGVWSHRIEAGGGMTAAGTLTIRRTGGALSGSITVDAIPGTHQLRNLEQDGATLHFAMTADQIGQVSGRATIIGDQLSGTLDIPGMGSAAFSATRTSASPQ
jgi:imidazolonepropionase-like amidohydrolase